MKHLLNEAALWREAAYIGGEWTARTPHGAYAVHNPADGALLVELPRCREAETRRAIDAARAAFHPWRRSTAKQRGERLRRWYELIVQHKDDLATLITLEEGKPLAESRGEIDYAACLASGMVGINCGLMSNELAPFGGVKQSGLGREGSHLGIDEYLEVKYLCWYGVDAA